MDKLLEILRKCDDEYLTGWEKIEERFASRRDLHAFILLDKLLPDPNGRDLISASEHDIYYLAVDPEELAEVATEEQLRDLARCGVRYEEDTESLFLFS